MGFQDGFFHQHIKVKSKRQTQARLCRTFGLKFRSEKNLVKRVALDREIKRENLLHEVPVD